jgi:hypothetical protein
MNGGDRFKPVVAGLLGWQQSRGEWGSVVGWATFGLFFAGGLNFLARFKIEPVSLGIFD